MHIPVLVNKVVEFLNPKENHIYVDATLGCGGYTCKIFEKCPNCKIIGIDLDAQALEFCKNNLNDYIQQGKLIIFNENFTNLKKILNQLNIAKINGIVFDFGLSMLQIKSGRGFSFNDQNLDMRINPNFSKFTAEYIVNNFSEEKLVEIFKKYGEEKQSKAIARKIVEYRKFKRITQATELKEIVSSIIRKNKKKFFLSNKTSMEIRYNPATKIFQALRIFINNELENIEIALDEAIDVLDKNSRILAVSYHSLEDRIVKHKFKNRKDCKIITKKPITADEQEVRNNPSARSAKLRVAEKI